LVVVCETPRENISFGRGLAQRARSSDRAAYADQIWGERDRVFGRRPCRISGDSCQPLTYNPGIELPELRPDDSLTSLLLDRNRAPHEECELTAAFWARSLPAEPQAAALVSMWSHSSSPLTMRNACSRPPCWPYTSRQGRSGSRMRSSSRMTPPPIGRPPWPGVTKHE